MRLEYSFDYLSIGRLCIHVVKAYSNLAVMRFLHIPMHSQRKNHDVDSSQSLTNTILPRPYPYTVRKSKSDSSDTSAGGVHKIWYVQTHVHACTETILYMCMGPKPGSHRQHVHHMYTRLYQYFYSTK